MVVVNPASVYSGGSSFARTGGTTIQGVVSDTDDTTYIRKSVLYAAGTIAFGHGGYTLGSGEIPWRARVLGRFDGTAVSCGFGIQGGVSGGSSQTLVSATGAYTKPAGAGNATLTTDWGIIRDLFPSGTTDQNIVTNTKMWMADYYVTSTYSTTLYKQQLEIALTTKPNVTITSIDAASSGNAAFTTASFSRSTTTATVTATGHTFVSGDWIIVSGVGAPFDGVYQISGVTPSVSFTYTVANSGLTSGSNGSIIRLKVTTTSRPTMTWDYSQADNIAQNAFRIRVFTTSKTDPSDNTGLVWDTGYLSSSTMSSLPIGNPTSLTPGGYDLVNGTTYYAYMLVGMSIGNTNSATYYSNFASTGTTGWGAITFSVALSPPTAPSTTATWNTTNQAFDVTATGATYAAGTQTFEIQRSLDGGTTWAAFRNASSLTPSGSFVATVSDYEVTRGLTTVQYRSRAIGLVGGNTITSAWGTATSSVTSTNDGTWWIKDPNDSTRNKGALAILADPEFSVEENNAVLRPIGRALPVVIAGAIGGADAAIDIAVTSAQWSAVKTLITSQRVLLLQDPWGEQRYIRITDRSYTRTGTVTAARYYAKVSFVEVDVP